MPIRGGNNEESWGQRHPWLSDALKLFVVNTASKAGPWIFALALSAGTAAWGFLASSPQITWAAIGAGFVSSVVLLSGFGQWIVSEEIGRKRDRFKAMEAENERIRIERDALQARLKAVIAENDGLKNDVARARNADEASTAALDVLRGLISRDPRLFVGADRDRQLERWLADTARRSLQGLRPDDAELGLGVISRHSGQLRLVCDAGVPNAVQMVSPSTSTRELEACFSQGLDLPHTRTFRLRSQDGDERWLAVFPNGPLEPNEELLCLAVAEKISLTQLKSPRRIRAKAQRATRK